MSQKNNKSLKQRQAEIIQGYTKFVTSTNQDVFIKHLDNFVSAQVEEKYNFYFDIALERGVLTTEDKLVFLEKQKMWTSEDEHSLAQEKSYCDRLKTTKSKMFLKADIESIKAQISISESKIKEIQNKKQFLLGVTAENYANKKANDYFLFCSLYKNEDLTEKFFSEEDFQELDNEILFEHVRIFNSFTNSFDATTLKKVALLPSFLNYFYLCEENPYVFYGKPVSRLTFFQAETFSHAKYFKYILSECKGGIPEEISGDPDKMIEWFESNKNVEKLLKKYENTDNMNVSLVGATQDDYDNLGLKSTSKKINISNELNKKGGVLNFEDMLKLQSL